MIELYERLKGLSPRQRQVVRLLYEGYSQREIADRLGVKRSTIRNHIERIRDRLRDYN